MNDRMNKKKLYLLGALALVFWVTIARMGIDSRRLWHESTRDRVSTEDIVQSSVIPTVSEALASRATPQSITFSDTYKCPFRPSSERRVIHQRKVAVPRNDRELLKLKGFLLKEKPLAILENNFGQTFICGVGEQAGEQTVQKITREEVVIKDEHGTYSLTVGE